MFRKVLKSRLVINTFSVYAVRLMSAAVGFLLSVVVARKYGPEAAGAYFYSVTVITVVSVFSRFGMDSYLVKYIASHLAVDELKAVKEKLALATVFVAVLALILSIVIGGVSYYINFNETSVDINYESLKWMAPAALFFSLNTIFGFALQGMHRSVVSGIVLNAVVPLINILIIVLFATGDSSVSLSMSYVIAVGSSVVVAFYMARKLIMPFSYESIRLSELKVLVSESHSFYTVAIAVCVLNWMPGIVITMLSGSSEMAVYWVAQRTSVFASFIVVAIENVSGPKFSALYKLGDRSKLIEAAFRTGIISNCIGLPIVAVLMYFADEVMRIFGKDYAQGAMVLRLLLVGQLVSLLTGPATNFQLMTSQEREIRKITFICAILCVPLCIILVKIAGVNGLGIGVALLTCAQRLIAYWSVLSSHGIHMSPIVLGVTKLLGKDK